VLIGQGEHIPYELGQKLLEIAEGAECPNRPFSTVAEYEREMVLWRWSEWRREQLARREKRAEVTPKAVARAWAELEYLGLFSVSRIELLPV